MYPEKVITWNEGQEPTELCSSGSEPAALGGLNRNKSPEEEQHEQSAEEEQHEQSPDVEDHSSDVDTSLMNLEEGEALSQCGLGNLEAKEMEAASEMASGSTGSRPGPVQQPPLFSQSCPSHPLSHAPHWQ